MDLWGGGLEARSVSGQAGTRLLPGGPESRPLRGPYGAERAAQPRVLSHEIRRGYKTTLAHTLFCGMSDVLEIPEV